MPSLLPASRALKPLVFVLLLALCTLPAQAQDAASDKTSEADACPMGSVDLSDASTEADDATAARSGGAVARAGTGHTAPSTDTIDDVTNPTPVLTADAPTEAEQAVQDLLKTDGVHIVHFWAPWCPNAENELKAGWGNLVSENPDVSFVFVSIWNDGESGASMLDRYDVPDRVTTLTLPDTGPSDNKDARRRQFLGLPFTWSPSTWIFHKNGELAFAMNYGEMKMSTVQTLIDNTQADW